MMGVYSCIYAFKGSTDATIAKTWQFLRALRASPEMRLHVMF